MSPRPGAPPGSSPLESASARRADVERAVGVLMVTENCGATVALVLLHERAAVARSTLARFALAVVVATAAGPPPGDATPTW